LHFDRIERWKHSIALVLVVVAAATVVVLSCQHYAGSWNDGSRLATVESLVDRHTWAIDDSIFVQPQRVQSSSSSPYPPNNAALAARGTMDKLFINGRYYSDKSPVPALLMAGIYWILQTASGVRADTHTDAFCFWMTLGTSGSAFIVAVVCVYLTSRLQRLSLPWCVALTSSFALATVAPVYSRHVNNHILLLAVASLSLSGVIHQSVRDRTGRSPLTWLAGLGTLAGLAYTIDLGAGPLFLAGMFGVTAYRYRMAKQIAVFAVSALPWVLLHHALNFMIGGTIRPANAVAEFFQWPGSPFDANNLTGGWCHPSLGHFLAYAADLLVGKRGFLGHNLALCLAIPSAIGLRRRLREMPEVLFAVSWSVGTWLLYASTSTNSSGACCSVRWFVPLLAPGYAILAIGLREIPSLRATFLGLSGWGAVLVALAWPGGPWAIRMVPMYWPVQAAAIATSLALHLVTRRSPKNDGGQPSVAVPALAEHRSTGI
jgi:hypothetical protein